MLGRKGSPALRIGTGATPDRNEGVYRFALLHPGELTSDEKAHNDVVLGRQTLGIEVTVPTLATRCGLGNIDPQHDGRDSAKAAIEACASWPLPPDGAWLVTVRPDLDAFGGMALFALHRSRVPLDAAIRGRVAAVAQQDSFAHGPWPGPRPLPSDTAGVVDILANGAELAAIAAATADHPIDIGSRVQKVADWLRTGEEPRGYRAALETRAGALAAAIADGSLRIESVAGGRIAVVEGNAEGAVRLGYLRAPVVVAMNPTFRFRDGPPHRKFTVCQYQRGYVDLAAVTSTLATGESGWGGSATIIGSPQGAGSILSCDHVVRLVTKALLT